MAKISCGRISGLYGMETHSADKLYQWANQLERRSRMRFSLDDPLWLPRWSKRLRSLAKQKEKAREHKARCRKGDSKKSPS